jgi:hypothetical protein
MRILRISFAVNVLVLLSMHSLPSSVTAAVHHVPNTFPTIHEAIVYSSDGDTVLVEPGIYIVTFGTMPAEITSDAIRRPSTSAVRLISAIPLRMILTFLRHRHARALAPAVWAASPFPMFCFMIISAIRMISIGRPK